MIRGTAHAYAKLMHSFCFVTVSLECLAIRAPIPLTSMHSRISRIFPVPLFFFPSSRFFTEEVQTTLIKNTFGLIYDTVPLLLLQRKEGKESLVSLSQGIVPDSDIYPREFFIESKGLAA